MLKFAQALTPSFTRMLPRTNLFWRTFLLLTLLVALSFSVWSQLFRIFERSPRSQQIAQQIVSVVNLTQSALINSNPERRLQLLADLKDNEGIRIYPLEPEDVRLPLNDRPLTNMILKRVRAVLGEGTELEGSVNGLPGLWVSFRIDDDDYWAVLPRERIDRAPALEWFTLGSIALLLALCGAVVFGKWLNRPLANITRAAEAMTRGEKPATLPEKGPTEVRLLNQSFNHMVNALERIDADRALILAGLSHDLRTPITRLRLESEMAPIDDATRNAINGDLAQMEHIVTQFLDYARISQQEHTQHNKCRENIDLQALVQDVIQPYLSPTRQQEEKFTLNAEVHAVPPCLGHARELRRAVINLIENAIRYGHSPSDQIAHISLKVALIDSPAQKSLQISVADRGVGVAPDKIEHLKRPFTRLDEARGAANGAGLGLAIVQRIAEQHHGRLDIESAENQGFTARLVIPLR